MPDINRTINNLDECLRLAKESDDPAIRAEAVDVIRELLDAFASVAGRGPVKQDTSPADVIALGERILPRLLREYRAAKAREN